MAQLIIGHLTTSTAQVWVSAGRNANFKNKVTATLWLNEEIYSSKELINDDKTFGTCVFSIEGLTQSTHYDIKVNIKEDSIPIKVSEHLGSFKTFPEESDKFTFLLGSCHYQSDNDNHNKEFRRILEFINHLPEEDKPKFMMHCGDQIYIDTASITYPITPHYSDYIKRYFETWSGEEVCKLFASLPNYMILDDHDLCNDYVWYDNVSDNNYRNIGARNIGIPVYKAFQDGLNPPGRKKDQLYYDFKYGNACFFVMDVRSERHIKYKPDKKNEIVEAEIISDTQLSDLKNWMLINNHKIKFIVTPVPFLTALKNENVKEDKWHNLLFKKQREEILKFIHLNNIQRLVFLSGDLHLSFHSKTELLFNDNHVTTLHEIISSPIKQLSAYLIDEHETFEEKFGTDNEYTIRSRANDNKGMSKFWKDNRCAIENNAMLIRINNGSLGYQCFATSKDNNQLFQSDGIIL